MNRNITYTEKDGYLYPDLELPEQKEVHIGISVSYTHLDVYKRQQQEYQKAYR